MLGFSFGAYHLCLAVAFSYQFRVGHKYRGQQLLAYLAVGADNEDETRISYLPINFNKSVDEAIECTTHCINTGQLMCRIDFDTTINDQTYSSIKNAYPFLTRLLQSLGSGNNFSAIEIFNNSSERFLSNNVTNQIIVFYPDTGAAVLARRDWQLDTDEALVPSSIIHTGSLEYDDLSINDKLAIVLCPQYSEVDNVLRVMNLCAERSVPCILINPSLINMDQGFGVRARNIRRNILDRFETTYKLKTLPLGALVRAWPRSYSLWKEDRSREDGYSLLGNFATDPSNSDINDLFEHCVYERQGQGKEEESNWGATRSASSNPLLKAILGVKSFFAGLSRL